MQSRCDVLSGFWQIQVELQSHEKTAFANLQGLYKFLFLPLGLMNATAVFHRLMQKVLPGLNPDDDKDARTL